MLHQYTNNINNIKYKQYQKHFKINITNHITTIYNHNKKQ